MASPEDTTGPVHLAGRGLHSGRDVAVTLRRSAGPVVFLGARGEAPLDRLSVVRADHGVRVASEKAGLDVDGVEHLLSALGGLSVHGGVSVEPSGGELPLLDGGALAFARALGRLGVERTAPRLRVAREGTVHVGSSEYVFAPAAGVRLFVEIDFDVPAIGVQRAGWDGAPGAYLSEVAPARTFGFRSQGEALARAGRARGVDPTAVMVLDDRGMVEPPGAPAGPAEFARHKLLDLVGDLYLFGGPPLGIVRVTRPGHRATHRALAEALDREIVVRQTPP